MRLVSLSIHLSCQLYLMMVVDTQSWCCQHILGIQYLTQMVMSETKKAFTNLVTCGAD